MQGPYLQQRLLDNSTGLLSGANQLGHSHDYSLTCLVGQTPSELVTLKDEGLPPITFITERRVQEVLRKYRLTRPCRFFQSRRQGKL